MKPNFSLKKTGALGFLIGACLTQAAMAQHPGPQPRPGPSTQTLSADGVTTIVTTPEGHFPSVDPFANPPGSNFLLTVYENMRDGNGEEMPNTLPSTPDGRYNLHDGPVTTQAIDATNPSQDLDRIIDAFESLSEGGNLDVQGTPIESLAQLGIDILEGNPIPGRAYSGFPMLHYNGPNKIKRVQPICQDGACDSPEDVVIGGNVDVNMLYWDQHIEADTMFLDPSDVQDVTWTITYHVNILHGGMEDFSPFIMLFDQTPDGRVGPFHVSMDQSFFPMLNEGTQYTVKIKQTKGKYLNLIYHWGWRIHPPRVQVIENALKTVPGTTTTLPQVEIATFGADPMGSEANKLAAIAQIGELAPAKRMWMMLRQIRDNPPLAESFAQGLRGAFLDWSDRTKLPSGVTADPDADQTLFYANNTIYGGIPLEQGSESGQGPASFKGVCKDCMLDWKTRPFNWKVTLRNGDHYPHGYMNVDFGGSRGWENQYLFTDPTTVLDDKVHTDVTVIEGNVNTLIDHVILDNSPNPAKQALGIDPNTGQFLVTNDKVFPANTGGFEEFLQPTPRNPDINADPQFGSGCFFTFGRAHAWPNAGGPWGGIMTPPVAEDGTPGLHKVDLTLNYEPTRRLRMYHFDPLHHDVAVFSLH